MYETTAYQLVPMYETSAYDSFVLSLIKLASRLIALVAYGPVPTVHEKTERALLDFDDAFFIFTFFDRLVLFVCVCDAFGARCSIHVENVLVNLDSQSPFVLMSSRVSSRVVDLLSKCSLCNG